MLGVRAAQVAGALQVVNLGLQLLVLVLQKLQSLVHLHVSTVCSLQGGGGADTIRQVSTRVEVAGRAHGRGKLEF